MIHRQLVISADIYMRADTSVKLYPGHLK